MNNKPYKPDLIHINTVLNNLLDHLGLEIKGDRTIIKRTEVPRDTEASEESNNMNELIIDCIQEASRYKCNGCPEYSGGICSSDGDEEKCPYEDNGEMLVKYFEELTK